MFVPGMVPDPLAVIWNIAASSAAAPNLTAFFVIIV